MISEYPDRNEQAESQSQCRWCGQSFTPSVLVSLDPLSYCSSHCAFAGLFYTLTCSAILITGVSIYITTYMLTLILAAPLGSVIALLFWSVAIIFWLMTYFGYRERTTSREGKNILSDENP